MTVKIKKILIPVVFLVATVFAFGQNFKTEGGSLEAISGLLRYNVIFEYSDDLKIPKHASETSFLEDYAKKEDKKESGKGELFKQRWISYRADLFEPKFIQEFNYFNLKEKQITIAPNISNANYTMVVRTTSIDPGNSNFFFKKDAWLKVFIRIYKTEDPATVLYSTGGIDVHSKGANSDIFDRIMSAYAELGRGLAKHLSRKT
ncbi:MAG: hypothetical protein AB8B59_10015 [Maribacter sp.]